MMDYRYLGHSTILRAVEGCEDLQEAGSANIRPEVSREPGLAKGFSSQAAQTQPQEAEEIGNSGSLRLQVSASGGGQSLQHSL
jgi:hypothetical protein